MLKTRDTFDFAAQPSINQALVRELARGEYMDRCENVLLVGNSGTAKTHLAELPTARIAAPTPAAARRESERDRNEGELDTRRGAEYP